MLFAARHLRRLTHKIARFVGLTKVCFKADPARNSKGKDQLGSNQSLYNVVVQIQHNFPLQFTAKQLRTASQ